ncbi:MAG: glycosyltransferase family 9 protein [Anaerolineae bacterium]|nr:glycosyltransferase family 9 protein [Anaerolineae bacterium]
MAWLYAILSWLLPSRPPVRRAVPSRIVIVLPCCIGDVVNGTAVLVALRRAYPHAHIAWAVGSWSRAVLEQQPMLDALIDTGPGAFPAATPPALLRFVRTLRRGRYDLAVSLVRTPRASLSLWLSGIPVRAGLDSGHRGFGCNVRTPINPVEERIEADIYLDTIRALGLSIDDVTTRLEIPASALERARVEITALGVSGRFVVVNTSGGRNPGMSMASKRYPPDRLARVIEGLRGAGLDVILAAGPGDSDAATAVQDHLNTAVPQSVGTLAPLELIAVASLGVGYIGFDTGLTHAAAAAGVPTVMILGPTSPARYGPHNPAGIAVWRPVEVAASGVGAREQAAFDWARDGVDPAEIIAAALNHFRRDVD